MTDKENLIKKTYFEVVAVMPGRTSDRYPNGWKKHIQGAKVGTAEDSPLGALFKIEINDLQEAFRLKRLIYSYHKSWVKQEGGGVDDVQIFEVLLVKTSRPVDDSAELMSPSHSDSLRKRLFLLANGVPVTEDMVLADQQAAAAHRARLQQAEERVRQQALLYANATHAYHERTKADYKAALAAGELAADDAQAYWDWLAKRPKFPPFEQWQLAIEAGEEPQLLLPGDVEPAEPAAPMEDETDLQRRERDEAEARTQSEAATHWPRNQTDDQHEC